MTDTVTRIEDTPAGQVAVLADGRRIPIPPLPATEDEGPDIDLDDETPLEAARLDTGAPR